MKRTTIFADEDTLRRLRQIAKSEDTTLSEVIRRALTRYVTRRQRRGRRPSLVGVGRSGRNDVGERSEELLAEGFGR